MSTQTLTFEEVDKHIQAADLSALKPAAAAAAGTAAAIPNVCQAYQVIKPILLLLSGFPFIPKKWRDAIDRFIQVMNSVCKTP